MGETTGIAWTDATFNPWIGCEKVSPACDNCYAEKGSARLGAQHGLKLWSGDRYFTSPGYWAKPAVWNRRAAAAGARLRVFCASFADVFEDRPDLLEPRARLWALIKATPHLDWLLLTKRPQNIGRMVPWERPNVWLGTTAETQEHYDQRWQLLAQVPAAVRFISHEPALGPLSLRPASGNVWPDWVITGGESGPRARAFNPSWAKILINDCRLSGIACFVKQLGDNVLNLGGAHLEAKGGNPGEWPPELRVRQFPTPRGVA